MSNSTDCNNSDPDAVSGLSPAAPMVVKNVRAKIDAPATVSHTFSVISNSSVALSCTINTGQTTCQNNGTSAPTTGGGPLLVKVETPVAVVPTHVSFVYELAAP
jgi:hypothetical protein